MTVGTKGKEYELLVHRKVSAAVTGLNNIGVEPATAGFGSFGADLELNLFGYKLGIEIKLDNKAQMGGGSYNYTNAKTLDKSKFYQSDRTHIDEIMEEKFQDMLEQKKSPLRKLLTHAKNNEKPVVAAKVSGLPLTVRQQFWEKNIKNEGYLRPLNMKTLVPLDFMLDHYDKKGIQYIQIGGSGFFYLKNNPLDLPIPKLTSQLYVEFRLGPAGSKRTNYPLGGGKTVSFDTVTANYRVQGRLNGCSKSSYDLERAEDVVKLFGTLDPAFVKKKLK